MKFRPEEVEFLLDLGSGEGLNYIPKFFGVSVENQTASLWMEFIGMQLIIILFINYNQNSLHCNFSVHHNEA